METMSKYLRLAGGNEMPIFGIGTFLSSPEDVSCAVDVAMDAGYQLIDTAQIYKNEKSIGDTLQKYFKSGKLKREDIFVTTKAAMGMLATTELTRRGFDKSLADLQLDYVDLYLLHFPVAISPSPDEDPIPLKNPAVSYDHIAAWKVLEQLVDEGKAKAIGLSNFNSEQIEKIRAAARIPISNLQVECHLYLQQNDLFQFCKERNITLTSYATLGSPGRPNMSADLGGLPGPMAEPVVLELSRKYNKTPAQILLRQLMQRGIAVIPKSVNPSRIKENFDVFDFDISDEDMALLSNVKSKKRLFLMQAIPTMMTNPDFPFNAAF